MPPVKFFESLDLDPIGLFLDEHYKKNGMILDEQIPSHGPDDGDVM
jgi:hypothetical protein